MIAVLSFICMTVGSGPAAAATPDAVTEALKAFKLGPADLHIKPDYAADQISADGKTVRLTTVTAALEHPLDLPGVAAEMAQALCGPEGACSPTAALREAAACLDLRDLPLAATQVLHANAPLAMALQPDAPLEFDPYGAAPTEPEGLPPSLRRAAARLIYGVRRGNEHLARAEAGLSPEELSFLQDHLPAIFSQEEPVGRDEALQALHLAVRLDRRELLLGALEVAAAFEAARDDLAATCALDSFMNSPAARFPVVFQQDTEFGGIAITGTGPNELRHLPAIVIDLGGDDTYLRYERDRRPGVSVVVDCGGNDQYLASSRADQGAAVLGISFLADLGGDDVYTSTYPVAQGAGIAGVGVLYDSAGDDTYVADTFSQGAGFFGVGLLLDASGRDRHEAPVMTQGFGGPGGSGACVDGSGDDRYFAGGRYPDRARGPGRFVGLAQGAALGIRSRLSGGIGVLADREGSDTYVSDSFSQGSGRWYGLGVAADLAGNDVRIAGDESQGAGAALGAGVLLDQQGDDSYVAKRTVQGAGLDLAVGVLADESGSDTYSAETQAQGVGLSNGIGVLHDSGGNDRYEAYGLCQGHGEVGRGYGSIGLLVDEGGTDRYSGEGRDGLLWAQPRFGIGLDVGPDGPAAVRADIPVSTGRLTPELRFGTPPSFASEAEAAPGRQLDELLGALAQAPDDAARREAARQLVALGERAVPRLVTELVADGPAAQVAGEVLARIGPDAVPALLTVADGADEAAARRAMTILGRIGDPRAASLLVNAGGQQSWRTRAAAASALGLIAQEDAVQTLAKLLQDPDEDVRRCAAVSLGRRRDGAGAEEALIGALADPAFAVRNAAAEAIVSFGLRPPASLEPLFSSDRPEVRYLAMETAGRVCSRAGLEALRDRLTSADWADRAFAAEALCRLGDPGDRERVQQLLTQELPGGFVAVKAEAALRTIGYCPAPQKG